MKKRFLCTLLAVALVVAQAHAYLRAPQTRPELEVTAQSSTLQAGKTPQQIATLANQNRNSTANATVFALRPAAIHKPKILLPDRTSRDEFLLVNIFSSRHTVNLGYWYGRLEENLRAHGMDIAPGHFNRFEETQVKLKDGIAKTMPVKTVCQTGFEDGHSALRFLVQSDATLYEFDRGEHEYAMISAKFLEDNFPGRITFVWGDSTKTMPSWRAKHPKVTCDMMIVGGGDSYDVTKADLKNFAGMSSLNHILLLDDTPCGTPSCKGLTSAWSKVRSLGCLEQRWSMPMKNDKPGFMLGRYKKCNAWDVTKKFS